MNSNITEIFAAIPDFSEFMNVVDKIGELSFRKLTLENEIKLKESEAMSTATREILQTTGKQPSVSYVEGMFKYSGFKNEIIPHREELARVTADLEREKLRLSVYKDMLEVWRTLSANERNTAL